MTTPATGAHDAPRLAHLPVSLFSIVMGLAGLTLAWGKAQHVGGGSALIAETLRLLATATYLLLLLLYGLKLVRHADAVKAELAHPVRINFFPALSIGLILLANTWTPDAPLLARWMWGTGCAVHLLFTLNAISSWIHHTHYDIRHANPAWFIPVVGNILVPIAGVHHAPADLSWFFFSIGLVFWLPLMTIVLYRLFFHEPLPARLAPTLFILIAPPAVGFLSYVTLTGAIDAFARVLYFAALFLTLLLASNALRFFRLPFFISAWAYSFPLAAMTIATFEMSARNGSALLTGLGWLLLTVLSAVVCVLVLKTVIAAARGRICVPE